MAEAEAAPSLVDSGITGMPETRSLWRIRPDPISASHCFSSRSFSQFLPNIGRLVVDSLEGTLNAATAARFAVDRDVTGATNGDRASNVPQELDIEELCGPEDDDKVLMRL